MQWQRLTVWLYPRSVSAGSGSGNPPTVRLPAMEKVTQLWAFLETLFEELMCCENFYTAQPLRGGCSKCTKAAPKAGGGDGGGSTPARAPAATRRQTRSPEQLQGERRPRAVGGLLLRGAWRLPGVRSSVRIVLQVTVFTLTSCNVISMASFCNKLVISGVFIMVCSCLDLGSCFEQ